ncbi:MAG: aminopeptidase P family protein [Bacilli bacterium]
MISVKEFKDRRERLYQELEDGSVLVLFAGVAKKSSGDECYDFIVNRNFQYLTNIDQEGSILIATKLDGQVIEYLFVSEYDEVKEKWTGKRLTSNEASKLSGITNVLYLNTYDVQLSMILDRKAHTYGEFSTLYLDMEPDNKIGEDRTTREVKELLGANYSYLQFKDIYKNIILLRMVKSAQEIEELKEAISKTNIGLTRILKAIKPGLYEYQLSSLFEYTIKDYDYSEISFDTIAASGINATTLHYPNPKDKLKDGDLMLFDLGARNNSYCADISRTYPINGKFTDLQKVIYGIVLECNKMVIKTVKPGMTIAELQQKVVDFLARRCLEEGLIKDLTEIRRYYFHNISHHIGLDTHDPSDRTLPLVSGNVISDEPGLYFKELGIGVRIEDDLLITDDGCYVLSGNIIKEIKDIERAMLYRE